MTIEEELVYLRDENKALREQLAQRDELIQQQQALLCEQQSGGQPGHPASSLRFSSTPDEIIELQVEQCEACQHDLHAVAACGRERRQVVDVPSPRVVVREYR